jgi:hypothetical protein
VSGWVSGWRPAETTLRRRVELNLTITTRS